MQNEELRTKHAAELAELDGRLADAKARYDLARKSIASRATELEAVQARIPGLEAENAILTARVASLQAAREKIEAVLANPALLLG